MPGEGPHVAPTDRPRAGELGPPFRIGQIGGRPAQIRVTVPLSALVGTADGPSAEPGGMASAERGVTPSPAPSAERGIAQSTSPGTSRPAHGDRRSAAGDPGAIHDNVAELEGYGPITPDVARAWALGGTWRRLVTDPPSGAVRDVGRSRYTPPADLAELVRARDRTCVRPGCGARAQGCDLDHTVPYHYGGRTAEWNLGTLCPTDHAMKTAGGYAIRQLRPGVFQFTTPSGHVYRRDADGSTVVQARARDVGPPPF